MINFFRNIRKELADDNRPIKYLRYAVGEIVLVVIGILIALQINTWNEERKLANQETLYLSRLLFENKQDIITFSRFIKELEKGKVTYISNAAVHYWINKDAISQLQGLKQQTSILISKLENELN